MTLYLPTLLAAAVLLLQPTIVAALQLNITALGAANNASTLECWQIDTPFAISTQPGTVGSAQLQLGNTSTLSYSVLPAEFDAGVHSAPANQYVFSCVTSILGLGAGLLSVLSHLFGEPAVCGPSLSASGRACTLLAWCSKFGPQLCKGLCPLRRRVACRSRPRTSPLLFSLLPPFGHQSTQY